MQSLLEKEGHAGGFRVGGQQRHFSMASHRELSISLCKLNHLPHIPPSHTSWTTQPLQMLL
jgi:hypothetical protein